MMTVEQGEVSDWLRRAGLSAGDYQNAATKMPDASDAPSHLEILWAVFRAKVEHTEDAIEAKSLLLTMAEFGYKTGREWRTYLQRASRSELFELREAFDTEQDWLSSRVEVVSAGTESCPACRQLAGRQYRIAEVLERGALPAHECTFRVDDQSPLGWCRCLYVPVVV
jgi:hypothetical protein